MVIPLSMMSLVQNIKFQLGSAATLIFIMLAWIIIFAEHGFDQEVPTIGNNQGSLVGFVLNNFAFVSSLSCYAPMLVLILILQITTIPSFVNELSRKVSIHRVILYAITICVAMYVIVGITGAASFQISPTSDILATLAAAKHNKALIVLVNLLFPMAVLVTSVPVFAIVMRYNLVRGNMCSESK